MSDSDNREKNQKGRDKKTPREQNALKGEQVWKLWSALKQCEAEFQAERPTLVQVAERMTKEMGFRVTENNIGAARRAGVIEWKLPRAPGSNPARKAKYEDLRNELRRTVQMYREHAEWLEGLVRSLYRELNTPFPEKGRPGGSVSRSET